MMMLEPARRLGIRTVVLDPAADAPCAHRADTFILGSLSNEDKIRQVVEGADITTYEIEHIDTDVLQSLVAQGHAVLPSPTALAVIQDKLAQRELLADRSLPVPDFSPVGGDRSPFGYPVIQKARRGGYDGKGVFVIASPDTTPIPVDSFWERYIDLAKELSVVVGRSPTGEIRCYDPVEMVVDPEGQLLRRAISPARITSDVAEYARRLAQATVEVLELVGVVAVELFLARDGTLLVNEVAPRPHNSGHHTIEAADTSQFEQHIRAVCGLPLGSSRTRCPAVTLNLVASGDTGHPVYGGVNAVLSAAGAALHLYGKSEARPWRKMGHITLFGDELSELLARAEEIEAAVTVTGYSAVAEADTNKGKHDQ